MNWAYSNLGLDLAAWVLQKRSSMPFPAYMKSALFTPLGMRRATLDPSAILSDGNRATGHTLFVRHVPEIVPMAGAGGIYGSAEDVAAFVRFHLARGNVGGRQVLDPKWLDEMYALPGNGLTGSAGLGVFKSFVTLPGHARTFGYMSNGGGFGFFAAAVWYPRLGIGGVVMANTGDGSVASDVLDAVLGAVIDDPRTVFHGRLARVAEDDPDSALPAGDPVGRLAIENAGRLDALSRAAAPETAEALQRYMGDYRTSAWGQATGLVRVRVSGSSLTVDGQRLYETSTGLFFAADGEALDFSGANPTWRNLALEKMTIPRWQGGLAALGVAAFLAVALSAPVVALAGRRGRRAAARSRPVFWTAFAAGALFVLAGGALAFTLAQFPFFIGAGMPALTPGVPLVQGILILLPELLLLLACVLVFCAVLSWRRLLWSIAARIACSVMAGGAVLVFVALAVWRLVGVGG
jgi:CubicO group peptidase (beta-lactamase class C family)